MKKRIGLVLAGIITVLAAAYVGMALFFQSHFCFGTTIDGIAVGGCNVGKVEQLVTEEINRYVLKLLERENETETIAGDAIDLAPVFHGEIDTLLKEQNGFAWIVTLFGGSELELEKSVTFDEEKLDAVLGELSCVQEENQRAPVSASCSGYSKEDGYSLVPADYGTTVLKPALKAAVISAVESLTDELDLSENGCYEDPKVGDDDKKLLSLIEEMNRSVGTTITYDFGEKKEILDGETISTWLSAADYEAMVDEEAVREYVKELAKTYNTAYKPKTLMTSYGTEVTISGGASAGRSTMTARRRRFWKILRPGRR